jgi:hypothetical protein
MHDAEREERHEEPAHEDIGDEERSSDKHMRGKQVPLSLFFAAAVPCFKDLTFSLLMSTSLLL